VGAGQGLSPSSGPSRALVYGGKLRHDLGFRGWQDDYDTATRVSRTAKLRTARVDDSSPVLVRALSLFGPGELRALRVLADVEVLRLVTSLLREASASGGGPAPQITQAMDGLCAIGLSFFRRLRTLVRLLRCWSGTQRPSRSSMPSYRRRCSMRPRLRLRAARGSSA
jgi:hypothetical protein